MRMRHLYSGTIVGLLVCLAMATPAAQSSAQIQAALQLFLQQPHKWTQTQTFQQIVVIDGCTGCGAGGASFGGLSSGTNTTAAMVVGTGASLATSGSGTIAATSVPASGISGNIPVTNLNGGTGASSSTFWRGDGTWASAGGGGSIGGTIANQQVAVGTGTNTIGGSSALTWDGSALFAQAGGGATSTSFGADGDIASTVDTANDYQFSAFNTAVTGQASGGFWGWRMDSSGRYALDYATDTALRVTTAGVSLGDAGGNTGVAIFNGTTSGAVTLSVADAAGTWTMKLPTTDGNSGEFLQTDGSGNTTWAAASGGAPAFSAITSATNTTAAMVVGTGASLAASGSGTITATAVPVGGISGLGTGVATALAVNVGSAGAFVTFNGALGTPSSGTATNLTGLPLSTGVTGRLPYANLTASTAASKILGRTDASAGDWQEITLGTGLTMSGTTLNASGGGITIGTTTITSGTNGRFLYDNSGVVGEATVTGTLGNVVLSDTPTLTTPNITTSATLTRTSIGTTSADGLVLTNTTAAAAGAQQYSPRLRFTAQGWKTNSTAASQTVDWIAENQPIQGAANPKTVFALLSQVNAGGYVSQLEVRPFGTSGSGDFELYLNNAGSLRTVIRSGGTGGSIAFNAQNQDGRRNFYMDYTGAVQTLSSGAFSWSSSSTDAQTGGDLFLFRDAANVLAQYNSTTAQAHRIYNTRTDASNYERATINWASNVLHVGTANAGTGTARVMQLDYGGTTTAAISIPITSGDITFGGTVAPTGYKSADGSAGVTVTTCTSFKNGLCVAGT